MSEKLYRSKHTYEAVQLTAEHFEQYRHHNVPLPLGACLERAEFSPDGKCKYGAARIVGTASAEIGDFIIRDDKQRGMVRRPEAFLADFEVDSHAALVEACRAALPFIKRGARNEYATSPIVAAYDKLEAALATVVERAT